MKWDKSIIFKKNNIVIVGITLIDAIRVFLDTSGESI